MRHEVPFALLALILIFSVTGCAGDASATKAPDFFATGLDGRLLDSAALKGKVVAVNFWATWCPPCRAEIPDFLAVYEANKDKGLEILGFSVDDIPPAQLKDFIDQFKITYPVAFAPESVIKAFAPGQYIPTTFLIDKKGNIRHKQVGAMDKASLAEWVDRLLKE
jgi:cytochrome c biogenesis protein CcmG/thiol:disulfide interchange protein DsbE